MKKFNIRVLACTLSLLLSLTSPVLANIDSNALNFETDQEQEQFIDWLAVSYNMDYVQANELYYFATQKGKAYYFARTTDHSQWYWDFDVSLSNQIYDEIILFEEPRLEALEKEAVKGSAIKWFIISAIVIGLVAALVFIIKKVRGKKK